MVRVVAQRASRPRHGGRKRSWSIDRGQGFWSVSRNQTRLLDVDRVADKVAVIRRLEDQNAKDESVCSDIEGAMLVVCSHHT